MSQEWDDETGTPPADPQRRPGLASVLLGLFILWELFYLPASNLIKFLPLRAPEHRGEINDDIQLYGRKYRNEAAQATLDALGKLIIRWGELSGQLQGWSLFAPNFGRHAALPEVIVETAGAPPVVYHSRFQREHPDTDIRLPETACRLFNYEYRLVFLFAGWSPESFAERPKDWHVEIEKRVRDQQRSLLAYLRWQRERYVREHPDAPPPTRLVLNALLTPDPPAEAPWSGRAEPIVLPLAAWEPDAAVPAGRLPVQMWDWTLRRFVWLAEEGSRD